MTGLLWSLFAWIAGRSSVAAWLIRRAQRTPYWHLEGYMDRFWLFNGWVDDELDHEENKRFPWLPSARVHLIKRADTERDKHNHPWPARTIVLKNWYDEERDERPYAILGDFQERPVVRRRSAGRTAKIAANDFHKITAVHPDGVWTLFITWRKVQTWGFMTKDGFVPHKRYFAAQRRKGKGIV